MKRSETKYVEKSKAILNQRRGQILIMFLGLSAIGLLLASSLLSLTGKVNSSTKRLSQNQDAQYLNEAGLEKAYKAFLANPNSYTGENLNIDGKNVQISVTNGTTNKKNVTATTTINGVSRSLRFRMQAPSTGVAVAFNYGMQAGSDGIVMGNNSTIVGNVYSNANIVAGNNSRVTGNASAVGSISNLIVSGTKTTGAAPISMPTFDAAFWKTQAQLGTTINGNYTVPNGSSIGPLYVTGNFTVGNSANFSVQGPIYVDGDITFGNSPIITVNNNTGSNGVMMVSQKKIVFGNSITITNNNQGGHLLLVSTSTSDGIVVGNSAGVINAPLYVPFGNLVLGNSARAIAFTAKKITIGNNTVLNFDSSLINATYASGPTGAWQLEKGSYQEY